MTQQPAPINIGLTLGALGVVFGDIGTSPLYAFRVTLDAIGHRSDSDAVLAVLSTIVWAIVLVVAVKYILVILRTNNDGEGGILALAALLDLHRRSQTGRARTLTLLAILGAAFLFGDGVLTPAISVVSAVEGIAVWSPTLSHLVVPLAVAILVALFSVQRVGVHSIGRVFGPIMLVWFIALAAAGLWAIAHRPEVLRAVSPHYAIRLALHEPGFAIALVSGAFLAVTGGEALYADLGQFGRRAITRAWLWLAMPALLLNYFGQGALVLDRPGAAANSFYLLFPEILILPMTALATAATVIASQAVVTGVFSLARQAIELGFLPPMHVVHTAPENEHAVYLPMVNAVVGVLAVLLTFGFASSANLAGAYGISVAGAMLATTLLYLAVRRRPARQRTGLPWWRVAYALMAIDVVFFLANLSKVGQGGFVSLAMAGLAFVVIVSWRLGSARMASVRQIHGRFLTAQVHDLEQRPPTTARTGVFLVRPGRRTSAPLQEISELVGAQFANTLLVSVWTASRPRVPEGERYSVVRLNRAATRVDVRVGYMQQINIPALLGPVFAKLGIEPAQVTYIAGLERPIAPRRWRKPADPLLAIYAVLARLASRSIDRFSLPAKRIIEIGIPVQL